MALTELFIKNIKPLEKPKKYNDGHGLYLYVSTRGLKTWRTDYQFQGKRKTLSYGNYPELTLKDARAKLAEIKATLKSGNDPGFKIKARVEALLTDITNSFKSVALEWLEKKKTVNAKGYIDRIFGRLKLDLFPILGSKPINEITAPEVLSALRKIEARGAIVTAHRCYQYCGQIFRYAVATDRATRDVVSDLRGALQPANHSHFASLTTEIEIGNLLRAIDTYTGNITVRSALKIAPYVFVRPGELRKAEWSEFNIEKAEWRIPATKMKMKMVHIVPLSNQVIEILEDLNQYTGQSRFLFPSPRSISAPISDMALLAGLRRLGYSREEMTVHGFRSMASTILNEQGYNRDWIERQLAHGERSSIRAAYNYADYLPQRREMMQEWANHLDSLKKNIR